MVFGVCLLAVWMTTWPTEATRENKELLWVLATMWLVVGLLS
jgi:hypothetical protein